MKKSIEILFICAFTILLISTTSAQETQVDTHVSVSNQIEFKGSSDTREIQIGITEDGCKFTLGLTGEIKKGSIIVDIFDHNKKKQGSFSTGIPVENKLFEKDKKENTTNYQERVSGNIMQKNASKGTWTIKINPQNAHGRLYISHTQTNSIVKTKQ